MVPLLEHARLVEKLEELALGEAETVLLLDVEQQHLVRTRHRHEVLHSHLQEQLEVDCLAEEHVFQEVLRLQSLQHRLLSSLFPFELSYEAATQRDHGRVH